MIFSFSPSSRDHKIKKNVKSLDLNSILTHVESFPTFCIQLKLSHPLIQTCNHLPPTTKVLLHEE